MRHEWFEYLQDPTTLVDTLRGSKPVADIFTFLQEAHYPRPSFPFYREIASASVLTFDTYEDWWTNLHFKVRNKVRKIHKTGVELRPAQLDDGFVSGVKSIYDETPIRQDRKFPHYGKSFDLIKEELSSFPECTYFIGAYHKNELLGFMKLFEGHKILRTVHIIAKLTHRDKCVMDALVAKAVQMCDERGIHNLHYGDWAHRGLGAFRAKFGFRRHDCARYYAHLTTRGRLILQLKLHHSIKERLPQDWIDRLVAARSKWYSAKYGLR